MFPLSWKHLVLKGGCWEIEVTDLSTFYRIYCPLKKNKKSIQVFADLWELFLTSEELKGIFTEI